MLLLPPPSLSVCLFVVCLPEQIPGTAQIILFLVCVCESYHGFPTLEADAGLNVVVASWTFLSAVVIQHSACEPPLTQLTCTNETREAVSQKAHYVTFYSSRSFC